MAAARARTKSPVAAIACLRCGAGGVAVVRAHRPALRWSETRLRRPAASGTRARRRSGSSAVLARPRSIGAGTRRASAGRAAVPLPTPHPAAALNVDGTAAARASGPVTTGGGKRAPIIVETLPAKPIIPPFVPKPPAGAARCRARPCRSTPRSAHPAPTTPACRGRAPRWRSWRAMAERVAGEYRAERRRGTRSRRFLVRMALFLVLVVALVAALYRPLSIAFMGNPAVNGVILGLLLAGIVYIFRQVLLLEPENQWIENFRERLANRDLTAPSGPAPRLLAPMAGMLGTRQSGRVSLSATSLRTLLDGIAIRLDETRETSPLSDRRR